MPRSVRIALGVLTSSAVLATAIYGTAFALRSAHASGRSVGTRRSSLPRTFTWLASTAPPTNWARVAVPSGLGSLAVPPGFRAVGGDQGTATLALPGSDGIDLGYLNVTPLQGEERLTGWSAFRLAHLRGDGSISARQDGSIESVRTGQSLRSCVIDDYVTEIGHHHFQEVACLVMSTSAGSVVVAATPWGDPAHVWAQLERTVAAYPLAHES
jgi:hypothetical protein